MNLGTVISRAASHFTDRCAFTCAGESRTFVEIDRNSNRFANGLLDLGLKKGDRVAIICDNSVQYLEAEFGIYKSGTVRVAINPMLSPREIAHIVKDSGSSLVLVSPRLLRVLTPLASQMPEVKNYISVSEKPEGMIDYQEFIKHQDPGTPRVQVHEDDLCMLFYTGGTTGVPKGAMQTHDIVINVLMNLQSEYLHLSQRDIFLAVGSLAHANGFRANLCFLEGSRFILAERFVPDEITERIEREEVTVISTVPTTLIRLCDYLRQHRKQHNLESLRLVTYGAAPMPTDRLKEAIGVFGNRLAQSYGQAEGLMAITHLAEEDHVLDPSDKEIRRLASAGRPYMTVEVRTVNDQGEDIRPGEIGEVIVKGKITMKGYRNNPQATAETLKDGWLYTGDLGTLDEEGYLYLVDRKKDMIISGGLNICAREVEDVLQTHPAIAAAAVIGVPDEEWGEAVKAVVALKPGMSSTGTEIIQFCKERLASFKKPKTVDFVSQLPETSVGKIDKKNLRTPYWEGQERAIH
jgi:acyl-CoA synthetase (AMP-forming)/AMP-acid ligase II